MLRSRVISLECDGPDPVTDRIAAAGAGGTARFEFRRGRAFAIPDERRILKTGSGSPLRATCGKQLIIAVLGFVARLVLILM